MRVATLVARSGEFNTTFRAAALVAVGCVLAAATSFADDIRRWRDAEGNLHYRVEGSEKADARESDHPLLVGRDATSEEKFSVDASLKRREIETKLAAAGRDLAAIREEKAATDAKTFSTWVPTSTKDALAAQASLDAQRNALLALGQFEEEKKDTLRRLRRRERDKLREIGGLWKEFNALDATVGERYGKPPIWWRPRLACAPCPPLAEVEAALRKKPTPAAEVAAKSDEEAFDEDEDEDEEEGWEGKWE